MDNTNITDTQADFSSEENILLIAPAPETTEEIGDNISLTFEPSNFVDNLGYMGTGMLGIFVVIAAIWAVTVVLNKIFSSRREQNEDNKE